MRLTDDQRNILAELNADARHSAESLQQLAAECDDFPTLLCELADADLCPPWEWPATGEGDGYECDDEIPF